MEYVQKFLENIKANQKSKEINNNINYEIEIPADIEEKTYRFRIIDDLDNNEKSYTSIIKKLDKILKDINQLMDEKEFKDIRIIRGIVNAITKLIEKYKRLEKSEENKNKVVNEIKEICNKYEADNKNTSEMQENILTEYKQKIIEVKNKIISKIKNDKCEKRRFLAEFKDILIKGESNIIGEYNFLKRAKCVKIDKKEIINILSYPLSRISKSEQLEKMDEDDLKERIKRGLKESTLSCEENYNKAITDYINKEILKEEAVIIYKEKEISSGNSQGKNALIYLDVLADDKAKQMYIVDQPGDDISHTKLKDKVIDVFRRMAINKQILFVTHKPELVVNLDVDNVIIIKENEKDGKINIINGALEYEKDNINILKDVADILDGGEETIRKRWKRYDK